MVDVRWRSLTASIEAPCRSSTTTSPRLIGSVSSPAATTCSCSGRADAVSANAKIIGKNLVSFISTTSVQRQSSDRIATFREQSLVRIPHQYERRPIVGMTVLLLDRELRRTK